MHSQQVWILHVQHLTSRFSDAVSNVLHMELRHGDSCTEVAKKHNGC